VPAADLDRLLLLLTVQIGVIIGVARVLGALMRRLRQPQVIGEIVAGLLLGPSFLGWLAPGVAGALFPERSATSRSSASSASSSSCSWSGSSWTPRCSAGAAEPRR
jgi:hypothetical protein